MYPVPDVDDVVAVAKALGIHLGPEEAALYRKYLMEQLPEFDTFVQARVEEPKPPMVSAARTPGYRPKPEEDPLNAWMWKCRIEGAAAGLLAGKTVSYKDHIAVAGMPMSFGAFALEGFTPDFDATIVTRVLQAGGTIIGKNVMNGLSGGFGTGGGIGHEARAGIGQVGELRVRAGLDRKLGRLHGPSVASMIPPDVCPPPPGRDAGGRRPARPRCPGRGASPCRGRPRLSWPPRVARPA